VALSEVLIEIICEPRVSTLIDLEDHKDGLDKLIWGHIGFEDFIFEQNPEQFMEKAIYQLWMNDIVQIKILVARALRRWRFCWHWSVASSTRKSTLNRWIFLHWINFI